MYNVQEANTRCTTLGNVETDISKKYQKMETEKKFNED